MQQQGPTMPRVNAGIECILCEYVMTELDSLLTENATGVRFVRVYRE